MSLLLALTGVGGGLDITATVGTATASGLTASVDRQLGVAATVGTVNASGITAAIDQKFAVAGIIGTATASGYSAGVDQQASITATIGTAAASGLLANVDQQINIAATLGLATAGGFTARVDQQIAISGSLGQAMADGYLSAIDFPAGGASGSGSSSGATGWDGKVYQFQEDVEKQKPLGHTRIYFDQTQARRMTQEVIEKAQAAPQQEVFDKARDVVEQFQAEIFNLELMAAEMKALGRDVEMARMQIVAKQIREQIEEVDAVWVMFMLAATIH